MFEFTRRDFLKTGAKGIAFAAVPIIFKANPLAALTAPSGDAKVSNYFAHFGVDEGVIGKVMAVALERGGDYCDIYFQHTINNDIILEDDIVNRAFCDVDYGVGIRVIEGEQTGYSFTEEITPEAMKLAAKTAANIASESRTAPVANLSFHPTPDYYRVETPWEDVKIDQKIPLLQKINERMLARDKRVIRTRVRFNDSGSYILIATSEGRMVCDYRPMVTVYGACTAEQNKQRERNSFSLSGRKGVEFLTPETLNRIGDQAVQRTVVLFDAVKPEGGEMEVVLGPGKSGILLHEAIGHGMEADVNRKGMSIFADKVGKPVAEKFVSIVDDGTVEGHRGSLNVDDEANDAEKTFLVSDGILRGYLHDRISARHYEVRPTGNGRRQSFRYHPIPRMRNTYMLPGPHKREEIIGSVKKGLYADSFTNGQVRIGPGDFTFYLDIGYLIEDGRLTRPVKDVNIIGNGPEVLSKIVMVADDFQLDTGSGTCGKDGQRVPASMGLPTVKVSSITVGGVSA
ncbi:MAG: TldD/PmbA family protein [Candidatus Zixiibacteriota bacterium]|nr:MAG: TldD/PmbA family protein [candidate division Zixibacteria bacterium]